MNLPRIVAITVSVEKDDSHNGFWLARKRLWADGTTTFQVMNHKGEWIKTSEAKVEECLIPNAYTAHGLGLTPN